MVQGSAAGRAGLLVQQLMEHGFCPGWGKRCTILHHLCVVCNHSRHVHTCLCRHEIVHVDIKDCDSEFEYGSICEHECANMFEFVKVVKNQVAACWYAGNSR